MALIKSFKNIALKSFSFYGGLFWVKTHDCGQDSIILESDGSNVEMGTELAQYPVKEPGMVQSSKGNGNFNIFQL